MKKIFLSAITVLYFAPIAFAQNGSTSLDNYGLPESRQNFNNNYPTEMNYNVHGRYIRSVRNGQLQKAVKLSDIVDGYPSNWITEYVNVEISATRDGKTVKAMSTNESLNQQQKNILAEANLGSDIGINVHYKYPNTVTNAPENFNLITALTVIPDKEAEYVGGQQVMQKYLKDNGIRKISETVSEKFKMAIIRFTINEKGETTSVKIFKSSDDHAIDQLLIDMIIKMPKWKPAENKNGTKVKQEFEISVGVGSQDGC